MNVIVEFDFGPQNVVHMHRRQSTSVFRSSFDNHKCRLVMDTEHGNPAEHQGPRPLNPTFKEGFQLDIEQCIYARMFRILSC